MNDASQCGVICFKSFKGLADRHGFEPDFSPVGLCFRLCAMCFVHPGFHGVVAARDASIMGGNFLDEREFALSLLMPRHRARAWPPHATRVRPSCALC